MKENWVACQECRTRASGIWLITNAGERTGFIRLCAQCGLYDYVHKRETFSPTLKLDLIRTFRTGFRQVDMPTPTIPVKHWVEHTEVPERRYANGMTASELLRQNAARRHGPSTVHPSLIRKD